MRKNVKAIWVLAAVLGMLALFATGCLALEDPVYAAQAGAAGEDAAAPAGETGEAQHDGASGQDGVQAEAPSGETAPADEGERDGAGAEASRDDASSVGQASREDPQEGEDRQAEDSGDQSGQDGDLQASGQANRDERGALERIQVSINREILQPGTHARTQVAYYPRGWKKDAPVSWSSSDPQLVTVNKSGLVKVNAGADVPEEGTYVDIWACTTDGSLVMDCVTVRIMPATQSLRIAQDQVTLSLEGDAFEGVAVEMKPESLVGLARVHWESSDESVVRVSASGAGEAAMLYAVGPGQAVVTARAQDSSKCSAAVSVTVE